MISRLPRITDLTDYQIRRWRDARWIKRRPSERTNFRRRQVAERLDECQRCFIARQHRDARPAPAFLPTPDHNCRLQSKIRNLRWGLTTLSNPISGLVNFLADSSMPCALLL